MKGTPCIGCGAVLPAIDGPTHRYMESSPACWAAYSEVLAREFGDQGLFQRVHRFTVDTYAVQHPGHPSPQSIQSVAVHLMSLCTLIEGDSTTTWAREIIREAVRIKGRFVWLQPPASMGPVTVADVWGAKGTAEHEKAVMAWARAAWEAWAPHHETIRSWCTMIKAPVLEDGWRRRH
jgi:Family of unknown function (DUF5946)